MARHCFMETVHGNLYEVYDHYPGEFDKLVKGWIRKGNYIKWRIVFYTYLDPIDTDDVNKSDYTNSPIRNGWVEEW